MDTSPTGILLDDGGPGLLRLVAGVAVVLVLTIFVIGAMPVALLVAAFGGAAPSIPAAQPTQPGPTPAVRSAPAPEPSDSRIVDVARRYLGIRYVFGGTDPAVGLDCSGLVQLVYRQLGVALPRTAQQQFDATARVPPDQLQPGDLVFFQRTYADPNDWITHVGIYIGGGLQINAPTEGQVVSIQPVFSAFWGAHFASGGRVRSVAAS